jgi:hypothetical protein
MLKTNLAFGLAACFVIAGATYAPKVYPVNHTEPEWSQNVQGLAQVREVIKQSNIPANVAFWCDSALAAQQNDIYRQVMAAKAVEDTTGKKKGGKP